MATEEKDNETKIGKNQFRCFHCRHVFPTKEGDWFDWDSMQVHLCKSCDRSTVKSPQRGHINSK